MKIVVLGLASDDVSTQLRHLQVSFGDAFESALAGMSFSAAVQTLFFTPIVTRPGIGPFPDNIAYLRREPAVNASINLSHERWIAGDRSDHVNMIAEGLVRIIDQIKDSKLNLETKDTLRKVVEGVRRALIGEPSP
jgi:hypothetical protein